MVKDIYVINSLSGNPGHLPLKEFGVNMTLLLQLPGFRAVLPCSA